MIIKVEYIIRRKTRSASGPSRFEVHNNNNNNNNNNNDNNDSSNEL